jgi:Spherulation-specific family 4
VPPEPPDTRSAGSWRSAVGSRSAASQSRAGSAAWRRPRPVVPRLVVPAYFHPAIASGDWARMARQASHIRAIVLNPASGPGDQPDPAYFAALQPLRDAGVTIAGYVDTNYGQRPWRAALADI